MLDRFASYPSRLTNSLKTYWRKNWRHKLVCLLAAALILWTIFMYAVAQWYIHSQKGPTRWGVSFIPDYAQSLGLDPPETMDALLSIGVKQFRLVSYWSDGERVQGQYDFSQLDWQFRKAEAAGAKVILTLGLRQPRWPECHMPDWAKQQSYNQWRPRLEKYVTAVVERYKDSSSLESYQVENEYFLKGFGICDGIPGAMDRDRLIDEYGLVKRLDPARPVIIGRSNNDIGLPVGQPRPDEFSVSLYKRVWDGNLTHRYLEHPQPSWYYAFMAGLQKLLFDRDMIIGELQAEAWPPNGQGIQETSLAEQNKSLDAGRLKDRFDYGQRTGMKNINLWGAEYWYYRLKILGDPSLWDVAKHEFAVR